MSAAEKGWKDVPRGGLILKAGNAKEYETGDWRTYKPVWDKEKCSNCMICWVFCPDASIIVSEGEMSGIDYKHCKGCGICAHECPRKCIEMTLDTGENGEAGAGE
jgi:pyruvate ferredoxin oxidoreductase delta subunit